MQNDKYKAILQQPIAIVTINSNGHHIRQIVKSAKPYKWTLDLSKQINYWYSENVVMSNITQDSTMMVQSGHREGFDVSNLTDLDQIIAHISKTKCVGDGFICSTHANLSNNIFPSNQGLKTLLFLKSAPIVRRYQDKPNEVVGQKIKVKVMLDDDEFNDKVVCDKIQRLGEHLIREISVIRAIAIGVSWFDCRFYMAKKKRVSKNIRCFNWATEDNKEENVEREVSVYEYYINYNPTDKPIPAIDQFYDRLSENKEEEKEQSNIYSIELFIGLVEFKYVFTPELHDYFRKKIYEFMNQPKDILRQYFKCDFNEKILRDKFWELGCKYYYSCVSDKNYLGDLFAKNMKVANGVRITDGYEHPLIFQQFHKAICCGGVMDSPIPDSLSINIYRGGKKGRFNGIGFHWEDDRYKDVYTICYTSNPNVKGYFSINQAGLKGTTEVDILTKDSKIWKFRS